MKSICLLLLFLPLGSFAQEQHVLLKDKQLIYSQLVERVIGPKEYLVNETIAYFKNYDLDGNYDNWFRAEFPGNSIVCVEPVQYESNPLDFLLSVDPEFKVKNLLKQIALQSLDQLGRYIESDRIISYTKAPFRNSEFGNLFKKKEAFVLSTILGDSDFALVKIDKVAKAKKLSDNSSRIVILKRLNSDWEILKVIAAKTGA